MRAVEGGLRAQGRATLGSAVLHLAEGVPFLHPEDQVYEAMLEGWQNQQLARNLAHSTIEKHVQVVRRFGEHAGTYPWEWTPRLADEWFADLRPIHHVAQGTVRGCQVAIRDLATTSPTSPTAEPSSASSGSARIRCR